MQSKIFGPHNSFILVTCQNKNACILQKKSCKNKLIECAKTDKMLKNVTKKNKTFVMSFHILLPFELKLLRFASKGMFLCLSFVHFLKSDLTVDLIAHTWLVHLIWLRILTWNTSMPIQQLLSLMAIIHGLISCITFLIHTRFLYGWDLQRLILFHKNRNSLRILNPLHPLEGGLQLLWGTLGPLPLSEVNTYFPCGSHMLERFPYSLK